MSEDFLTGTLLRTSYGAVYESLQELREIFHRSGRLDDSNAKLDEVTKIFATYFAFKTGEIASFPAPTSPALIEELQQAFVCAAVLPRYRASDGTSMFGTAPTLSLRSGDEALAVELTRLVKKGIDIAYELRSVREPFDILNEAFGHFVRDNFRGNIEDAQYMTPPEVVSFMADLALLDEERELTSIIQGARHLTVVDPTCGVGSFLAAICERAKRSGSLDLKHIRLFGQDKVERMVRLSTLNLQLFDVEQYRVSIGNSLSKGSPLDELNGNVDLILTNPPFGARFEAKEVAYAFADNTPFFSSLRTHGLSIDSELLFIDRNLRLLRAGGRLLIIVPDGVISARGLAAMFRQHLSSSVLVRAVIELPSVTFAQAGTRTKTAILYLQKRASSAPPLYSVFMATAGDIGFQVRSRKGVQVKVVEGRNELPQLLTEYKKSEQQACAATEYRILSDKPSAVLVPVKAISQGWTPSHYSATRFKSIESFSTHKGFDLVPLNEVAEFMADLRRPERYAKGSVFISVLHVLGEGLLDFREMLEYAPKTPGVVTKPGEILLSRINPRITRVCVVPDLGVRVLCSAEFEIMRAKDNFDVFVLAFLLQTKTVQNQIRSLTSGTSASHNRIRTAALAEVRMPVPKPNSREAEELATMIDRYKFALQQVVKHCLVLSQLRAREDALFGTDRNAHDERPRLSVDR